MLSEDWHVTLNRLVARSASSPPCPLARFILRGRLYRSFKFPSTPMVKLCLAVWGHHHRGLALFVFASGGRLGPMRAPLPVAAFLVPLLLGGHRALGPFMAASRGADRLSSSAGSHGFHAGSRGDYGSCRPYSPDFLARRTCRPLVFQRAVCLSVG